jgi:hypothetical protein
MAALIFMDIYLWSFPEGDTSCELGSIISLDANGSLAGAYSGPLR